MVAPIEEPAHYAQARRLADAAPLPAAVGNVACGTAGWTDPTLLKSHRFYPKGANKSEARLRHYAQHFRLVEVDATYYTLLEPIRAVRWLQWTSADFVFDVKAHASMTGHAVDAQRLPKPLRERVEPLADGPRIYSRHLPTELLEAMWLEFEASVRPLLEAGRLGSVLMQFPPWFTATRGNVRHIEALAERWADYPIATEFRHGSWMAPERRERVFALLERLAWSYVVVDEPQVAGGGVPAITRVTNPELAVFRFHGQNTAGWRRGSSVVERFNYLYRPQELEKWVPAIREAARQAKRVHVVFNNCVRDFAVVNAKDLAALLVDDSEPSTSGA